MELYESEDPLDSDDYASTEDEDICGRASKQTKKVIPICNDGTKSLQIKLSVQQNDTTLYDLELQSVKALLVHSIGHKREEKHSIGFDDVRSLVRDTVAAILELYKKAGKRPATKRTSKQLLKLFDDHLYEDAVNVDEYCDVTTLEARLTKIAKTEKIPFLSESASLHVKVIEEPLVTETDAHCKVHEIESPLPKTSLQRPPSMKHPSLNVSTNELELISAGTINPAPSSVPYSVPYSVPSFHEFQIRKNGSWVGAGRPSKLYRFQFPDGSETDVPFEEIETCVRHNSFGKRQLETPDLAKKIPRLLYVLLQSENNKMVQCMFETVCDIADKSITATVQNSIDCSIEFKKVANSVFDLQRSFDPL